MRQDEMDRLIDTHVAAEIDGNLSAATAVYTPDVVHDVVGWPSGSTTGPDGARDFYEGLIADFTTEAMELTSVHYGNDFCVTEHQTTGTVPGSIFGIPGHGRRVSFRMLHLWEFRDGGISRENIWLDSGTIVAQLTAP